MKSKYTPNLWQLVDKLGYKLQRCLNIVNEYPQSSATKVKTVKDRIKKVEDNLNQAVSEGQNEQIIIDVIERSFIPFADDLFNNLRWSMNRVRPVS